MRCPAQTLFQEAWGRGTRGWKENISEIMCQGNWLGVLFCERGHQPSDSIKAGHFVSSWVTVNFSRKILATLSQINCRHVYVIDAFVRYTC
jgi:hypothetical protein